MPRLVSRRSLRELPATFTYADAQAVGISKHVLYGLRDAGFVDTLARGLYRRADAGLVDVDLLAIVMKAPRATLCLATALAHHGLADVIPAAPDIALPRGTRPPTTPGVARWHTFTAATFDVGRDLLEVEKDTSIGVYGVERSIVDAFRTRATEGHELGHEALRRWLRRRGAQPSQLLALASQFPKASTPLHKALEVLL